MEPGLFQSWIVLTRKLDVGFHRRWLVLTRKVEAGLLWRLIVLTRTVEAGLPLMWLTLIKVQKGLRGSLWGKFYFDLVICIIHSDITKIFTFIYNLCIHLYSIRTSLGQEDIWTEFIILYYGAVPLKYLTFNCGLKCKWIHVEYLLFCNPTHFYVIQILWKKITCIIHKYD